MSLHRRWVHHQEYKLSLRDRDRRIFPFEWGTDWISDSGPKGSTDPLDRLKGYAGRALEESDRFYAPPPLPECLLEGEVLSMPTPTPTAQPENNTVFARLFPSPGSRSAVIVVPQWNAREDSHVALCRTLAKLGMTCLRLCMPYHERRRPPQMERADFMVSSNVGRTLHAVRQAILEVRMLASWLKQQGYEKVGVLGTSVGSCISYLAFVHDPIISTGVFNHVSSFFADVVWTGLSTRYVRWGLEGHISLEDLRKCWAPISPWFYPGRLRDDPRSHLLVTARYDLTFRPELTHKLLEEYRSQGVPYHLVSLPCGHYTTAKFPYKYLVGWHVCRFLRQKLIQEASA